MTTRKSRPAFAVGVLMLIAAVFLFISLAQPVWAAKDDSNDPTEKKEIYKELNDSEEQGEQGEQGEGYGVHEDPATFQKNFELTAEQKEYTITEIKKVISMYTKPQMSDLQKYYELAKWANQRVVYDGEFWNGKYNMEYYSHQWDAYGAINEDEKSVCAGIAIFYSNLCHAADLPCKFVRLNPKTLDHTITYIPDINGNAYYADITENDFLMSKNACGFAEDADLDFSGITNENAEDSTFEYREDESLKGSNIKDCWQEKVSYKAWFNEFALHKDTDLVFENEYVEKGSGTYGRHYASYRDFEKYPPQPYVGRESAVTGIWFLDDFYKEPTKIKEAILAKEFDDQLLNVTGIKNNYDFDNEEDIVNAVTDSISVNYFPSSDDEDNIVAEAATLTNGIDYEVNCAIDASANKATVTITGKGAYSGTYTVPVTLHTASVAQAPVKKNSFVYDGSSHELIDAGTAENGTMQYALGTAEGPTEEFTEAIPAATNAGAYHVWYRVLGDETHVDSEPEYLPGPVRIDPIEVDVTVKSYTVSIGKTVKLSPKLSVNIPVKYTFVNEDASVAKVNDKGVVKGLKKGTTDILVKVVPDESNQNYYFYSGYASIKVVKAANPIKLKANTVKLSAKALQKKSITVKRTDAFKVSKAKGTLSYKLFSAKQGKTSFKNKFSINAKTGVVTVKKGLKNGTYKVTAKVKAKGTARYKASAWKKVTFTVKI